MSSSRLIESKKFCENIRKSYLWTECHLGKNTFQELWSYEIHKIWTYTGTRQTKRPDAIPHVCNLGPVIATVSKDELNEASGLTPIKYIVHETTEEAPEYFLKHETMAKALDSYVQKRNKRRPSRHHHARHPQKRKKESPISSSIRWSSRRTQQPPQQASVRSRHWQTKTTRKPAGRSKKAKEVIVATVGVVSTGVIKSLNDLVLQPHFSNELLLHQLRGLGMRLSEGKDTAYMHLMYDGKHMAG